MLREVNKMKKLLCEVNISEGRNLDVVKQVKAELMSVEGISLIDLNSDSDHNRTVYTYTGEPHLVLEATKKLACKAIELIDMTKHNGSHPRMGAVDVVPFVPVNDVTMEEAVEIAREFGKYMGDKGVPVFYYEDAALVPERKNLVSIRKGEYEALKEKFTKEEWKPDEGPFEFVPRSGALVTGVRFPLVAFNVNLNTNNLDIAKTIAKSVRGSGGGFKYVRAIGLHLTEKDIVQVSMNLVNYEKTPIPIVMETIRSEASKYGVAVVGSELVGPVPLMALEAVLHHYLQTHDFSMEQIYS